MRFAADHCRRARQKAQAKDGAQDEDQQDQKDTAGESRPRRESGSQGALQGGFRACSAFKCSTSSPFPS